MALNSSNFLTLEVAELEEAEANLLFRPASSPSSSDSLESQGTKKRNFGRVDEDASPTTSRPRARLNCSASWPQTRMFFEGQRALNGRSTRASYGSQ